MRILHTGARSIDPKAFREVANVRINKPMSSDGRSAGFWGSTEYEVNGQFTSDWHKWTAFEDFKCFDYGVSFELKPGTRILTISSVSDLEKVRPEEETTEETMNGFVESFDPYNADWKRGVPKIMKAIRQKHGLTQKELGLKLGLSENSIGRIEGGFMVRPKRDTMDKFGILKTLW